MPDDVLGELTWSERAVIRRIRCGWTKAQLADACGLSRVTLYLVMECKDETRRLEPTERVRQAVEAALARREAERAVATGTLKEVVA